MDQFPKPPADRRKKNSQLIVSQEQSNQQQPHQQQQQQQYQQQQQPPPQDKQDIKENSQYDQEEQKQKKISDRMKDLMLRQNMAMCDEIKKFAILGKENLDQSQKLKIPKTCNIILFGPSGSGKSSLIKTFYQGLHNIQILPEKLAETIIISDLKHNEGTKKYTRVILKPGKMTLIESSNKNILIESNEIAVIDTRGQINLSQNELQQLNLMIDGKVKDMSMVEQRNYRYAYLLWEFWKKDSELFPNDIIAAKNIERQPHSIIIVFDGSLDQVPNGEEETQFYKDIIDSVRKKKYYYPQIVLTRVDKVEEKFNKLYAKMPDTSENEKQNKLREYIDMKVESVVMKLNVPRTSVHFIENYHENQIEDNVSINYYALKLLKESLKQGEHYIQQYINEFTKKCNIFQRHLYLIKQFHQITKL